MAENDRGNFYQEYTCTGSYVFIEFGFTSRHITLVALGEDGVANTGNVSFSFNGINLHGVFRPGEGKDFPGKMRDGVHIKDAGNTDKIRIWAY